MAATQLVGPHAAFTREELAAIEPPAIRLAARIPADIGETGTLVIDAIMLAGALLMWGARVVTTPAPAPPVTQQPTNTATTNYQAETAIHRPPADTAGVTPVDDAIRDAVDGNGLSLVR
jgi:hypothetical protein